MGKQSCKSKAKFRKALFQTNFLQKKLLQHFERIVTTEFHSLLKVPHGYQKQQLRDEDSTTFF